MGVIGLSVIGLNVVAPMGFVSEETHQTVANFVNDSAHSLKFFIKIRCLLGAGRPHYQGACRLLPLFWSLNSEVCVG
jgi:hypothetical protein